MLNHAVGTEETREGRSSLVTTRGQSGHALYGPYEVLQPGRYAVEFNLELADGELPRRDVRCALLDVVTDVGRKVLVRKDVYQSQLQAGRTSFSLTFTVKQASRMEYRVWVSGDVALRVDAHRRVVALADGEGDAAEQLAASAFPEDAPDAPAFFREHLPMFRALFENGVAVGIIDGKTVLRANGISFYANQMDDLNFIGEVFEENAYNVKSDRPVALIDIGMNIGLTSLQLAAKPEVHEVHSFEPFVNTYDRAMENIALNPSLASKIAPHNVGLSNRDADETIKLQTSTDSGAASIIAQDAGTPVHISIRDAGTFLSPVIAAARAKGLGVLVKVDCEGSEFAIFESLERAGLLGQIDAFMVEWHAMFADRTQDTLIAPLRRNGFMAFDRSPRLGNGFFYAVRMA